MSKKESINIKVLMLALGETDQEIVDDMIECCNKESARLRAMLWLHDQIIINKKRLADLVAPDWFKESDFI